MVRIELIDDPGDPRLDDYRDLKDADLRRRRGVFVAESRDVVRRLLASRRFRTRSVLLTPSGLDPLRTALDSCAADVSVLLTRQDIVRAVVGYDFHRGCLAIGERGMTPSLHELAGESGPRFIVGLEALTNPDNVGGVFRNAMAFGVDGALLSPSCADPLYRKAVRVSAGGSLVVPFARVDSWLDALSWLRGSDYHLIALTPDPGGVDLDVFVRRQPLPPRAVLLIGTEATGLATTTLALAHVKIRIPMAPGIDSLNVATACGIALYRLRAPV